jgi:hypothetical protein
MNPPADVPARVGGAFLSLARQAGIGKEHVDRPIFGLSRRYQRLDVFFESDVGGNSQSIDIAGDSRQPVARCPEVGDDNASRAGLGVGACDRRAMPLAAPVTTQTLPLTCMVKLPL